MSNKWILGGADQNLAKHKVKKKKKPTYPKKKNWPCYQKQTIFFVWPYQYHTQHFKKIISNIYIYLNAKRVLLTPMESSVTFDLDFWALRLLGFIYM